MVDSVLINLYPGFIPDIYQSCTSVAAFTRKHLVHLNVTEKLASNKAGCNEMVGLAEISNKLESCTIQV